MATKSKTKPEAATKPQLSIPDAVRDTGGVGDAMDLLNQLSAVAPAPSAKKKESNRVEFAALEGEEKVLANKWFKASILGGNSGVFVTHLKSVGEELKAILWKKFTDNWFQLKSQPQNPKFYITNDKGQRDSEAIFTLQEKVSVQIPQLAAGEKPQDGLKKLLVNLGLKPENATKLVLEEIDFTPTQALRPFNELAKGHYEAKEFVPATDEEQAVAKKILQFVFTLSAEERAIALRSEDQNKVKSGFFERVAGYVDSAEQLRTVLKVVKPVYFPSHSKFGISDTADERVKRLSEEADDIVVKGLGS